MGIVVFIGIVFFIVMIRVIAGGFDSDRVRREISAKGGRLISKEWSPFGKGWFGDQSDRIYKVRYLDKGGNEHEAYVKTSLFSGVYFTEDKVIKYANSNGSAESEQERNKLALENARLRAEVGRLKSERK